MCDKAVDNYCNALEFVPEFYKTHKICDRAIDKCQFMFDSFLDIFNTQEMCYSRWWFSTSIKIYSGLVCYK